MNKFIYVFLFVIISVSNAFTQEKRLTIENVAYKSLRPEGFFIPKMYNEDDFIYSKDNKDILIINPSGNSDKVLISLDDLNASLEDIDFGQINYFSPNHFTWKNSEEISFSFFGHLLVYNINTKEIIHKNPIPEESEKVTFFYPKNLMAYTSKNNIYYVNESGSINAITDDENPGIVNGSSNVHRNEFGIKKGIFWSPQGNFIAFYRKDETKVADYPMVDITKRIAQLKNIKYPMIGQKSEEVTLGIYSISAQKTVFANVTDFTSERYLTSITWDPNEKYIYIGVLNREQNHLKLNKYVAKTGAFVKTLFEEKNEKYVEPQHPLIFVEGLENSFIWNSQRDGYNHLYLYDTDGNLKRQLTKGQWVVTEFKGFDKNLKNFFIMATKTNPLERHLYSVNFKTGKMQKLTEEPGTHSVVFSKSKKYYVDIYTNFQTPSKILLKNRNGKIIAELLNAKNPLQDIKLGDIKVGKLKAADNNTDIYYRMVLPPDIDTLKKYPVIFYVYGGPHAQKVNNRWMNEGLWNQYMAQEGYIVFCLDNRGSSNRGFEFESVIFRQMGQEEMRDQMKGVEYLKSLNFVDSSRIGVHGGSYGGFMTVSLMLNYPKTFKVGVAIGTVIDWKYYEVMYGERYMDTPQDNPEGFKKTSLLNKAENLQGKLLLIHGYMDPVVVPQNSIDFLRASIKAHKDVDFFLYPESGHGVRGQGRLHYVKMISKYFDDHLKN